MRLEAFVEQAEIINKIVHLLGRWERSVRPPTLNSITAGAKRLIGSSYGTASRLPAATATSKIGPGITPSTTTNPANTRPQRLL